MKIIVVGEKTLEVVSGQSILNASLDAGIQHYHACGGNAKCSTCRILVLEGYENLSPINKKEALLRSKIHLPSRVRLACQTFLEQGDATIERIIKDELDLSLFPGDDDLRIENQELGHEKELVLFFLDIKNFTPFVETYLPFDVIHVVRRLFHLFHNIIHGQNGQIVETAGDGLYAVFGRNTRLKKAADNAIQASREIVKELDELNKSYLKKYFSIAIEVGIGIHLGKVIVGKIKIGDRNSESIMGLAVNVASRLQTSTRELNNNIVISQHLCRHSSLDFRGVTTEIHLKGINQLVRVCLIGEPFKESNEVEG